MIRAPANGGEHEERWLVFLEMPIDRPRGAIKFLSSASRLSTCSHATRARASCLAVITKRGNVRLSVRVAGENRIFFIRSRREQGAYPRLARCTRHALPIAPGHFVNTIGRNPPRDNDGPAARLAPFAARLAVNFSDAWSRGI